MVENFNVHGITHAWATGSLRRHLAQ
jgi:hypothetical protein